jgi:hypothetical protein
MPESLTATSRAVRGGDAQPVPRCPRAGLRVFRRPHARRSSPNSRAQTAAILVCYSGRRCPARSRLSHQCNRRSFASRSIATAGSTRRSTTAGEWPPTKTARLSASLAGMPSTTPERFRELANAMPRSRRRRSFSMAKSAFSTRISCRSFTCSAAPSPTSRARRRCSWPSTVCTSTQLDARGLPLRRRRHMLERGRERKTSPFHDFGLSRGVTWLEPTLHVEVTYSEVMEGRLRDPVYRGLA